VGLLDSRLVKDCIQRAPEEGGGPSGLGCVGFIVLWMIDGDNPEVLIINQVAIEKGVPLFPPPRSQITGLPPTTHLLSSDRILCEYLAVIHSLFEFKL
jgi:hypothetical protein